MKPSDSQRAVVAAKATASALGLVVDDVLIINDSDRVVVLLTPCNVVARVALPAQRDVSRHELKVALRLKEVGAPVGILEPQVEQCLYEQDGFDITLWTYYEPRAATAPGPAEYAVALAQLHAGLRQIELRAPHFMDRVGAAQALVADREQTLELSGADRELLADALGRLSARVVANGSTEQLLHGEAHLENVLSTQNGVLFVDLGTCCRGPIEFDLAHSLVPSATGLQFRSIDEVCQHYPGTSPAVVEQSRILIWAMITTWRWRRHDQLPNGRHWANEGLVQLRAALDA